MGRSPASTYLTGERVRQQEGVRNKSTFKKWEFSWVKAGSASALVGERSFLSRDEALTGGWQGRMRRRSLLVLLRCSPGSLLITLGVQEGWVKRVDHDMSAL